MENDCVWGNQGRRKDMVSKASAPDNCSTALIGCVMTTLS